jgi:choline kinase
VARSELDVVVLAAGRGSRLAAGGWEGPKWLLDVNGRTIASLQLSAIREHAPGHRLVVVTGFRAEAVESWLTMDGTTPCTLHNERWDDRNNWWSLLLALRHLDTIGSTAPMLLLNSDLFAPAAWFGPFIAAAIGIADDRAAIGVDVVRRLTDEAMKVSVRTDDAGPLLRSIGKVGVEEPVAEYVGIAALGVGARGRLRCALEAFDLDDRHADEWYEAGIRQAVADGLPVELVPMPDAGWVEIDDAGDLQAAGMIPSVP